jgi:hypothetical protein
MKNKIPNNSIQYPLLIILDKKSKLLKKNATTLRLERGSQQYPTNTLYRSTNDQ